MKRKLLLTNLIVVSLVTAGIFFIQSPLNAGQKKKLLRVGVYDSRGIAIAYAHSDFNDERYKKMKAELDKAQAAGDEQEVAKIKEMGNKDQAKKHLQGFGTASVHEYLELVKKKLPNIAKTAGVDIIVSKWEFDYMASDADVVDVTMELAKLFSPREKAYQWIEQMKDIKPISEKKLQRLEKEHKHSEEKAAKPSEDKSLRELRQTFDAYMQACIKKDIEAMTDVYDLEYIAIKWKDKVGDDRGEMREMIKGVVVNKPDAFYRVCTRAKMQSVKVTENQIPNSIGKSQIAEIKFEDWSWTFRKTPKGWKLIEEGASGETFNEIF